ncbi:putative ribonuclease H-like domain-containing protein [Tanacetum coccineum]
MKKMYCLVVTDDFSRFSWVFFLATKDETSEILKTFTTGIENLIDLRVKVIRCDNRTEFNNRVMNQFCEMEGIEREFIVARTPQQNGPADPLFSQNSKESRDVGFKPSGEEEKKDAEDPGNESRNPTEGKDSEVPSTEEPRINQEKDDYINITNNINIASDGNSTNNVNVVSSTVNATVIKVNAIDPNTSIKLPNDPNMPKLEDIVYSDDDEDIGAEADMNNLDAFMPVSPIPTTKIHKYHPVDQIIGDLNLAPQKRRMTKNLKEHEAMQDELLQFKLQKVWTLVDLPNGKRAIGTKWVYRNKKDERGIVIKNKARLVTQGIEAIRLFLAYASFKDFVVYQIDVKSAFLYAKIEEEVYLPELDDIIFGSTKKKLYIEFEKMMHKKFQMSSMGELTFFLRLQVKQKKDGIFISQDKYVSEILKKFGFSDVKTASTPMESHKPLLKDADGEDVDEQYFLRPNIFCSVCLCNDTNQTKVSYPSLFDYAVASLDRKSTTGGCQFLGCRLISWQCKKQTVVANSTTKAEYIAASNCCGQLMLLGIHLLLPVFVTAVRHKLTTAGEVNTARHNLLVLAKVKTINGEVQIQALVDKKKVIITETSVRSDLQLEDAEGTECLPNATIFEQLTLMSGPTEPITDEAANEEHVPTHSNDPLLSGEERLNLNELMELCTNLSQRVLDLENTKTSQGAEITKLKERVKKLERRNKSRTPGLKRLRKVGITTRIESSEDEGLGDQEDASKQERKIVDIDADEEEVEVKKVVSTTEVTTVSATTTTVDELTLAQTLIKIKAAKPKAVTTAATTTTTAVTRPKARGVVVQEPSEFTTTTSPSQPSKLPQAKDKGKEKMVELEKPLKKKDQFLIDEEITQKLQEELQAKLEEEERLARQKEEDANIAEWDNVQAMIDADYELAVRLQAQEQEIVLDDEVAIDAIPLATKPPIIVDWKIIKEGKMGYFKIIRVDGSSRRYSSMIKMLQSINREDLETLWKLVKAKHRNTRPKEAYERVLWGGLKVMFELDIESEVWRNLQGHKVTVWKLFSSSEDFLLTTSRVKGDDVTTTCDAVTMTDVKKPLEDSAD